MDFLDLKTQYAHLQSDIQTAVHTVLANGQYIGGPNVSAFEQEIAEYTGAAFAVALNSGTDALYLALRALDIGPGDEVITTPFSFIATSEAIAMTGARPVFADIDPATFNLDPGKLGAAVTAKTRAIVPVHLYGAPASMPAILATAQRHGLAIVEDCAQSLGAAFGTQRTGTFGAAGCFSFFPSKNLGACGDGGMLTTNSAAVAQRVRRLRAHGSEKKYYHDELGVNSRLDEIQAAILRVKLRHLDAWSDARRAVAARYSAALGFVERPQDVPGAVHVYHQYTIALDDRDAVRARLSQHEIPTMVYYPLPLHLQPAHAGLGYAPGDFPNAERASQRVLSLPIYPELTGADQKKVIEALSDVAAPVTL